MDITFTSNDGTADSEPSQPVTVKKGTLNKTFSGIEGAKAYYTFTFVTYDKLGNKGKEYKYKVSGTVTVSNIPEGFVEIPAASITGSETWTPYSNIFVSGRKLNIEAFWMSDHQVTREEYKNVVGSDPSTASAYDKDGNELTGSVAGNNPVTNVSWYDVIVYCNKRSINEGLTPCYTINGSTDPTSWGTVPTYTNSIWNAATCDFTANGYRLPTEAEWELAARGEESYNYAGSDNIDDVAWYTENTNDTGTREVKTKKPNGYGLYDMSGNVREWCWDWDGMVDSSTPESGVSSGSYRCLRGGSWYHNAYFCTVAYRDYYNPYDRNLSCGFRLVRSAQ
ncbi:MAG: SUMF1/EgtB/PvdO family nonheme iron enzyme [Spirochaetales bacterium]|nr:SUMF1/EgtB/PvdO family nonheme iron enzyme [Spirochaetales bacterium]